MMASSTWSTPPRKPSASEPAVGGWGWGRGVDLGVGGPYQALPRELLAPELRCFCPWGAGQGCCPLGGTNHSDSVLGESWASHAVI